MQEVNSSYELAGNPDLSFFLPSLSGGGVERVVLNLATAYAKKGLSVHIVVARKAGELVQEVPRGIQVIDLKASLLTSLPAMTSYMRRNRPKVLFSAVTSINLTAIWARQLAKTDTRLVISEHVSLSHNIQTHPLKRALPRLIRLNYPKADALVAVSQGLAKDIESLSVLRQPISVIYNPIITNAFTSQLEEKVTHPWFQDDIPIILGVGRLSEQKNFSLLIDAFASVRKDQKLRLLILGEGEQRAKLEQQIKRLNLAEDVVLLGYVKHVAAYMRKASLFALSSNFEGFGNVLVEAMYSGCPVVSTDCPVGPSEILCDGDYGALVTPNSIEAMARAIKSSLCHPIDKNTLKNRAQDFSLDKVLPEYSKLLFPKEKPVLLGEKKVQLSQL